MSGPADRLLKAVADPHRQRVTVRADDLRMLLFAAGFSDADPEAAQMAGNPISMLKTATLKGKEPRS